MTVGMGAIPGRTRKIGRTNEPRRTINTDKTTKAGKTIKADKNPWIQAQKTLQKRTVTMAVTKNVSFMTITD